MGFKDHFSGHAAAYEKYRPEYPPELFQYLAQQAPANSLCWDCGTGNGQAARGLAKRFERVIATDASADQVSRATGPDSVEFRVAPAEASGLEPHSVDLVAVAQAFHWFSHEPFFREVQRVVRPKGILAVWGYQLSRVNKKVDERVNHYYDDEIGGYWSPERRLVDEGYASVAFPGEEVNCPPFVMEARWTVEEFLGYLGTWSATQKAKREGKEELYEGLCRDVRDLWGEKAPQIVSFPLFLRVFIMTGSDAKNS